MFEIGGRQELSDGGFELRGEIDEAFFPDAQPGSASVATEFNDKGGRFLGDEIQRIAQV